MGLDTTHNCWHGSYSGFMDWRRAVAKAVGIDLDKMEGFAESGPLGHPTGVEGLPWPDPAAEPLVHLLNHSDCDGELAVETLLPLAARLREVAPLIEGGGIDNNVWSMRAIQFAEGCERAAAAGEMVEFY